MTQSFVISHLGDAANLRCFRPKLVTSVLAIVLSCGWVMSSTPALAQDALLSKKIKSNDKKPMLIQADELVFDNKQNAVKAQGNVEIYYNDYTLVANKVTYLKGQNRLIAEGNVRIKEPDGAIVTADKIELTDDFKQGFIRSLKVVAKDDTRIGARSAERTNGGNTTIFTDGMFTPCKACKDHPEKAPIWQIKSHKIIHNKVEKTIEYEDATFEFMGVPVAYLPYFSHADPTVKRKSGFLTPSVGYSTELGAIVGTPYFWSLAENYDVTLTPVVLSNKGYMGKAYWRHRLANGSYSVNLSGVIQTNPTNDGNPLTNTAEERDWRGSIDSKGDFSLGSYWNVGWDATIETDDTYRRYYKIDSIRSTDRVSKGYLIGQAERSYFSAQLYHFGGLVIDDTATSNSVAAPLVDYNYVSSDPVLGGELSFNANVTSLQRDQGTESNRAIAELKWRKTLTDGFGQMFTPFAQARGDIYQVKNVLNDNGSITAKENFSRGAFTGGVDYRFPFVSQTATASHVIEPIGQIVVHGDTGQDRTAPNEDAQSLVFDDSLLFDTDKFSGYDRFETGTRANVGLQYTVQFHEGGYIKAVVGQSFQLGGNNAYTSFKSTVNNYDTGLETNRSDYVAGLYIEPSSNLSITSQARFDEKDLSLRRIDNSLSAKYGPFSLRGTHIYQDASSVDANDRKHQVTAASSVQIVKNWYLLGELRYDIESSFMLSDSIGLKYADECFLFAVNLKETFTSDDDIKPDTSVMFRFEMKHLGGFGYNYQLNDATPN